MLFSFWLGPGLLYMYSEYKTKRHQAPEAISLSCCTKNMKTAILATLVGSAAAFAPSKNAALATSLSASFESELGAQAPYGAYMTMSVIQSPSAS
jgi:TctA family transporter